MYTISDGEGSKTLHHFISGAGAGSLATVAAYPMDVVRTRFVAQGNAQVNANIAMMILGNWHFTLSA